MAEWAPLLLSGGSVLGFWAWARAKIVSMTAKLAVVEAEVAMTQRRCENHRQDSKEMLNKIGDVAEAVARIEGKLE